MSNTSDTADLGVGLNSPARGLHVAITLSDPHVALRVVVPWAEALMIAYEILGLAEVSAEFDGATPAVIELAHTEGRQVMDRTRTDARNKLRRWQAARS